jgi:Tfp pilus assembly protein PilF
MQEIQQTATHQADQPTGAMQLAMLANAAGKSGEAEAQYRRAVERDPASVVARMDYAVFLAQQHRPVDALRQMLTCAREHPQNAEVQYRLGLILIELRQYRPALRAMQKALQIDPQHQAAAQAARQLQPYIR